MRYPFDKIDFNVFFDDDIKPAFAYHHVIYNKRKCA